MNSSALNPFQDSNTVFENPDFDGALYSARSGARAGNPRITLTNGEVLINGTHSNNTAQIFLADSQRIRVHMVGIETRDFSLVDVNSIRFLGRKGNDTLSNSTSIPITAFGHEGDDNLSGGRGADTLYGGPGADQLSGNRGDDRLFGESGNDTLRGSFGNDSLYGANGNDVLYGDQGADFATGDAGDDLVYGGAGNDVVHGWTGIDTLLGQTGNDYVIGGDGDDDLNGGAGTDWMSGGNGDDFLNGGTGNDKLFGGFGRDELMGNNGNDELNGGHDSDLLYGAVSSGGANKLAGGSGQDHVFYYAGDTLVDIGLDRSDLRINLKNSDSLWTIEEVRTVNRGLELLHNATGNNALVTDYVVGKDLLLEKVNRLTGGAAALNTMTITTRNGVTTYDRVIKFAEWDENNGPINDTRVLAFVHEVAHNFDNDFELEANPSVSPANYTAFTNLSGWRSNQANSNYVRSQDGQWWYHRNSQFYRSYSTVNPGEDWATIWELNFNAAAEPPASGSNLSRKLNSLRSFLARF